jgi:hypothetical protein
MSLLDTASLIVTPNGYKEGTLYSVIPSDGSGDMSVVRATTATRVNSAGLVELVPYNLFTYSQTFSNADWTKANVTVTGGQSGYDGSSNAFLLTDNSTNDYHIVRQTPIVSGQYTISVYAKANTLNWLLIRGVQSSANVRAWFNLSTGVVGIVETNGTATIESVGNGWYRCSLTIADFQSGFESYIGMSNANGTSNYVGSGQSIYIQNAQSNLGTIQPYQKTETRLNIPRLDYSNGTCPSLLVEPQRTNLVTNSSAFSNWLNAGGTVTNNTTTAPDGTMTADTLTGLRYQVGFGTNVYTFSCYAKANGGSGNFYIRVDAPATFQTLFDLINGVIDSVPIGYTATIKDVGNGWFRCTMTTPNITLVNAVIASSDYGANSTYIWGAQLEAGSYPTSYIPTTSASVTRNADVVSKTGISSLIGQTEGALFIDTYIDNIEARTLNVLSYLKGTVVDKYITISNTGGVAFVDFPSINISSPSFGLTNGRHKFAIAYKTNDFAFYIDGVQVGTASSGVPSACSEFGYSYYASGYDFPLGVNATALWKTRLTNTQLAQLTTI